MSELQDPMFDSDDILRMRSGDEGFDYEDLGDDYADEELEFEDEFEDEDEEDWEDEFDDYEEEEATEGSRRRRPVDWE
jgi:hypothetical protein